MNTVLFLGAGATKAQWDWESERHALNKLHENAKSDSYPFFPVPLRSDFLSKAKLSEREFQSVEKWASASHISVEELEDLFTALCNGAVEPDGDEQTKQSWHDLLICYRKVIGCSTNVMTLPLASPLPDLIKKLSRIEAVVTTNQDLVFERALLRTIPPVKCEPYANPMDETSSATVLNAHQLIPRPVPPQERFRRQKTINLRSRRFDARLSDYYALRLDNQVLCRKTEQGKTYRQLARNGWPEVPVLKIHGSLNWWYASKAERDPAPKYPNVVFLMADEDVPVGAPVIWDNPPEPFLYPVIVPFVRDKKKFIEGLLEPVWEAAEREMSTCQRLVVVGYHLADDDKEAQELFSNALKGSNPPSRVDVINTCEDDFNAVRHLITPTLTKCKHYYSIEKYLDAD